MENFRICIVGAGIAGLTTAALLKKEGLEPVVLEKEPKEQFNTSGYMLGMLPLGGRVMNQLDLRREYDSVSQQMNRYEVLRKDGSLNRAYDLSFIEEQYGNYNGIERAELIKLLRSYEPDIHFGTSVSRLEQSETEATVTLLDGSKHTFDIVIIADGIHSSTRSLLWKRKEFEYYDTGWGGWVAWLEGQSESTYRECWGAASFLGLYPVKSRTGIFLGGSLPRVRKGKTRIVYELRKKIPSDQKLLRAALDQLESTEHPFFWEFHDCRTREWQKGNVILLGDAACAFLPTAGVGASMAMDSAAALVDELCRAEPGHIQYALKLFVKRQKKRVENAQKDSRNLGKFMFVKSAPMAALRDFAMKFYSIQELVKSINKTMEG